MRSSSVHASRHPRKFKRGFFHFALSLVSTLLLGCQNGGVEQVRNVPPSLNDSRVKIARAPRVTIFEDEAMLKGSEAIIGGKVQNTSDDELKNLFIEMQLVRRSDGGTEIREVQLKPSDLLPGEEGEYSIRVSNHAWVRASVLRISSHSHAGEISFKSEPGAQRPPERVANKSKVIVIQRSKSKGGDDFINTPDNPEVIR